MTSSCSSQRLGARIKGKVYGEEARQTRWSKLLVMSDDHTIIEMQSNGEAVDITVAVGMACTTGKDASEASDDTRHSCVKCGQAGKAPLAGYLHGSYPRGPCLLGPPVFP